MADSRLNIIIEAQNKAKATFNSVAGDLDQLKSAAGGGAVSFSTLSKAGALLGVALGAIKLGETVFALGEAAAKSDRLSVAFGSLSAQAGQNATAMLAAMRRASDGTISNTELIASANRAMLLGVADNAEEMTKLLEVASARGKAMGLSTAQAFSDLVTGIGRMSPLILDNLGIVTGGEKVFEDYAKSIGRSADSLSDAEKKQALLNKVVAESQPMIASNAAMGRDMAANFERLAASTQNAREGLAGFFAEGTSTAAGNLADTLDYIAEKLLEIQRIQNGASYGDLEAAWAGMAQSGEDFANQQGRLTAGQRALASAFGAASDAINPLPSQIAKTNESLGVMAGQADRAKAIIEQLKGALAGIAAVQENASAALRSSFLGLVGTIGGGAALEGYRKANQLLEIQTNIFDQLNLSEEERAFRTEEFVEGIRSANTELERTLNSTTSVGSSISAFDSLKDKLSGVLSGALSSGINLDDILPRQDAIEEDARRLADVAVNGYASPWAAYLQDKFPQLFAGKSGDIKGIAAGLLRDFEDGLRPELLDRERAKDRVRRMLLGEANISQLAQDIAGELAAEFGGQFSQADILSRAQSALGAGGAISSGATSVNGGQIASNALGSIEAGFADDKAITKAKNIGANFMRTLFEGAFDTADTFPFWDKLLAIIIQQRVAAAGAN